MNREQTIIRTSVFGIGANLVLVAFKAAVGLISGSIAVILDAVNNLSDALSSVITIIGTKLAGRAPDKKHPYGHGRIEYITGVLIAVIVLVAGLTSMKESVEKIIHPEKAEYTAFSFVIIVAAILAKLLMGRYSILWGLSLEGWFGAVISIFILKAGYEMLMDTLNSIIGLRADKDLTDELKACIAQYPNVRGVYDMTLHNYGPTQIIGSVHVEVPDEMQAREIHKLTRAISAGVYQQFGIVLTVGIYASNDSAEEAEQIRGTLDGIVSKYPGILQVHGFYLDVALKTVTFDMVVDFSADRTQLQADVLREMQASYPDYQFNIVLDSDYSD